jgi:hypothetical protein
MAAGALPWSVSAQVTALIAQRQRLDRQCIAACQIFLCRLSVCSPMT